MGLPATATLLFLVIAGAGFAGGVHSTRQPVARIGKERTAFSYPDPLRETKAALLEQINADRKAHGAPPLQPEHRAAKLGDDFCRAMVDEGSLSHFDSAGRPPYLRWTLAGGIDYHAENVGAYTSGGDTLGRPLIQALLAVHATMMTAGPPNDRHRATLLSPDFTHVGIGVAVSGGNLRVCEEFITRTMDWVVAPAAPVTTGAAATVQVQPQPGWEIPRVEVLYEEPASHPREARSSYSYPPAVLEMRPERGAGFGIPFSTAADGIFPVSPSGRVTVRLPPLARPGQYYVICHARRKGTTASAPATVIRIDAA